MLKATPEYWPEKSRYVQGYSMRALYFAVIFGGLFLVCFLEGMTTVTLLVAQMYEFLLKWRLIHHNSNQSFT